MSDKKQGVAEAAEEALELVQAAGGTAEVVVQNTDGSISTLTPLGDVIAALGSEPEEVVELDSILGESIAVLGYEECEGEYGTFYFILFRDSTGALKAFTTGGVIIRRKLAAVKAANRFPVSCVITKPDNYYNIV